jgi:ribosome-associated protein YbcJ (S4-like RNA binding protein)
MSSRPVLRKRANKVRKLMRQKLPAYIDLVQWLQDHGHADTAGAARKLIADKRVKTRGGNVLGRETPLVDAKLRREITVVAPK